MIMVTMIRTIVMAKVVLMTMIMVKIIIPTVSITII